MKSQTVRTAKKEPRNGLGIVYKPLDKITKNLLMLLKLIVASVEINYHQASQTAGGFGCICISDYLPSRRISMLLPLALPK